MKDKSSIFIGIDGGGTKTRAVAIDYEGKQIYETVGGPGNVAASGVNATFKNLKILFDDLADHVTDIEQRRVNVVLGLAGLSDEENKLKYALLNKLNSLKMLDNIQLVNDAYIAWYGIDKGNPAVAVISGTGSSSNTRDAMGNTIVKGGMGHNISDEGSGYHIGLMGIRSAVRATKRIEASTMLTRRVTEVFSLQNIDEAPYLIKDHVEIAAFARHVYEASLVGDSIASGIIEHAAGELARLVEATWRDGEFGNNNVKVGMFGGCPEKMTTLRSALRSQLQSVSHTLILSEPVCSPAQAAAELARNTYIRYTCITWLIVTIHTSASAFTHLKHYASCQRQFDLKAYMVLRSGVTWTGCQRSTEYDWTSVITLICSIN